MIDALADLLFPPRCLVCRRLPRPALCAACTAAFVPVPPPVCARCGVPLPAPDAVGTPHRAPAIRPRPFCRRCARDPPPFAEARAMTLFTGPLRRAVHALKFEGRRRLGPALGDLLAAFVASTPSLAPTEVVVPVPLPPDHLRVRGYNHAALLAEPVARRTARPLLADALGRDPATRPQHGLDRAARAENVRAAFRPTPEREPLVRDRWVLLVDDVLTSGATAAACSLALLAGGARAVSVVTLARTDSVQAAGTVPPAVAPNVVARSAVQAGSMPARSMWQAGSLPARGEGHGG